MIKFFFKKQVYTQISAALLFHVLKEAICNVFQIDIVTTDTVDVHSSQEDKDESSSGPSTSLLLRMGPHRCENLPDILVECAVNHPFFVKDKGQ